MSTLEAIELLSAWERSAMQSLRSRALTLLSAAYPAATRGELEALSVGRRDDLLLDLRARLFGRWLECLADCPACYEPIEISFSVAEVRGAAPQGAPPPLTLLADGYALALRPVDSTDLAAVAHLRRAGNAAGALLARCLLAAAYYGEPVAVDELPAELLTAAEERLEQADPLARLELALVCPVCGHSWAITFDIVSFLWAELDAWARRALREVHALAMAYGWSEADILAMSPSRRQIYLELIEQ